MPATTRQIVSWILIALIVIVLVRLLWGLIRFFALVLLLLFGIVLIFRIREWGRSG